MNEFTFDDQAKPMLINRMKQRARQLKAAAARERTSAPTPAPSPEEAEPKKPNTFRLHPKRWIAIATSAALVLAAIPTTLCLTLFNKSGGSGIISGGKDDDGINTVKLDYMENMMVDVNGVTAYSIRRETEGNRVALSGRKSGGESNRPALSLLSASAIVDSNGVRPFDANGEERNYLYSTNVSYEFGNVEYDENGITKVSFMKNKEVTEDIYDENGKLIDSNRKITQEELDSQINKIYTTAEYTFIQFVPLVEKSGKYAYKAEDGSIRYEYVYLRPEGMKYDEQGVADFDKAVRTGSSTEARDFMGYYTSALSASFVIDNATGYIYKLENFRIDGFNNGLIKSCPPNEHGSYDYGNPSYYAVRTDKNNNLIFTDVLPNKTVKISEIFMDKYGWVYVLNNQIDEIDRNRKIIYTTDVHEYVYDADKTLYKTNGYRGVLSVDSLPYSWTDILEVGLTKRIIDGKEVDLEPDALVRDLKYFQRPSFSDFINYQVTGIFKNLSVFHHTAQSYILDGHIKYVIAYDANTQSGLAISDPFVDRDSKVRWMDDNYDVLTVFKDGRLYYASVNLDDCNTKFKILGGRDFTSLSDLKLNKKDSYYLTVGKDEYKINDVYYYVGASATTYYRLVRTRTGVKLEELTSKSYADNVFIFQPINK